MTQQLRRSQFVLTWGPGAILEGPKGPRIIPLPNIGLFGGTINNVNLDPEMYEIPSQRMSQGLLDGARIFRLPSNAELHLDDNHYVYRTKPFLYWSLCVNHEILYRSNQSCPECRTGQRGHQEAIRFVRACPQGHLDDIDWDYLVHRGRGCRTNDWYHWKGIGGPLSDIKIECPECGEEENFGRAYSRDWPCNGRFPEREPLFSAPVRSTCNLSSRIIQRQASSLRMPEIVSLFTIPRCATTLHRLLEITQIRSVLFAIGPCNRDLLFTLIDNLAERGAVKESTVQRIGNYSAVEVERAIQDILNPVPDNYTSLIDEELNALIDASANGWPSANDSHISSELIFEVDAQNVARVVGPGGHRFRITPVLRLNSIVTQVGYRRLSGDRVDVSFTDEQQNRWYPGTEFLGEGIFIMLEDNNGRHFPLMGDNQQLWQSCYQNSNDNYESADVLFRDALRRDELHPAFVWWHTLSHLLLRVISIDSGYSAASIRERVYLQTDGEGCRGGIILYATQPGADGTLGGIVSLVPRFEEILRKATELAEYCSNDPLCYEQQFACGSSAGAACYGCLLVSETSCEHRNIWLDRHVILENMP